MLFPQVGKTRRCAVKITVRYHASGKCQRRSPAQDPWLPLNRSLSLPLSTLRAQTPRSGAWKESWRQGRGQPDLPAPSSVPGSAFLLGNSVLCSCEAPTDPIRTHVPAHVALLEPAGMFKLYLVGSWGSHIWFAKYFSHSAFYRNCCFFFFLKVSNQ